MEARRYLEQALAGTRQVESRWYEGYALSSLGDALTGLRQFEQAAVAYEEALVLRRNLSNQALILETQAGKVRLHLVQQDIPTALTLVEEILTALGDFGLDVRANLAGAEQPLRILLTCYQVLQASEDRRAVDVLRCSYDWLQDVAAILPEVNRSAYLENIPWNREIMDVARSVLHIE